ncbi:MAG: uracil-DNA glycosylase [Nanoarchaeota archaeon]
MNKIDEFIKKLSNFKVNENVHNQYENKIRQNNLKLYLEEIKKINPRYLLVGEAAGYQGCRLSGIPFTSELIILNGIDKLNIFGEDKGYKKTDEQEIIQKEKSATMVWETLSEINKIPLLWNAFPFHPFKENNENSNRLPRKEELLQGEIFLKSLINLFDIKTVIAVGNIAKFTLNNLGYKSLKVRHPAYGGKAEFKEQLTKILK